MARKLNTTHTQIAQEYRVWLRNNPDATQRRKFSAFDRIADKHLKRPRVAA